MVAAYAIAYDWLYDVLSDDQKQRMRNNMILYGMAPGKQVFNGSTVTFGWWSNDTQGNWNCVCNSGLTLGALAILGDDTTGTAEFLLGKTITNALGNCVDGVTSDGTWTETANYWYFGTTGHAEMASALLTAAGSHYGLLDSNAKFTDPPPCSTTVTTVPTNSMAAGSTWSRKNDDIPQTSDEIRG